jgi:hypothetical protein
MVFSILKQTLASIFPPAKNATAIESAALSMLDAPDDEALPPMPPSGAAIVASIGILAGTRYFGRPSLANFPNVFLGLWYGSISQLFLRSILSAPHVADCKAPTDTSSLCGEPELTSSATPSSDSLTSCQSLLSLLHTSNKDVVNSYDSEVDTDLYPRPSAVLSFEPNCLLNEAVVPSGLKCNDTVSASHGMHFDIPDACHHELSCGSNDSCNDDDDDNQPAFLTHRGVDYTIPYGYLGRGSFGHVVYAHTSTGEDVAIKVMQKTKLLKRHDPTFLTKMLKNEVDTLKMLSSPKVDCPFVMKLIRSWQDEDSVYFVMVG